MPKHRGEEFYTDKSVLIGKCRLPCKYLNTFVHACQGEILQSSSRQSCHDLGGDTDRKRLRLVDLEARMVEGDLVLKIEDHERLKTRVEGAALSDDGSTSNDE